MSRQAVAKVLVLLMLCASGLVTANLTWQYVVAVVGVPVAQWQLAFLLLPAPLTLALLAVSVAWFSRPRLSRPYLIACGATVSIPLALLALVLFHAY